MKRVLITGGSGFIGSALIRYIINQTQDSVINIDKLTYAANQSALKEVENNPRYAFEQVDICDLKAIESIFEKYQPDVVMHLAAESHVDRSITGAADFIQTNIVGTYTLLEVAKNYWHTLDEAKKTTFRFHHISTDEVYGDLSFLILPLLNSLLIIRVVLIPPQKQRVTIWCTLGIALMVCR